MQATIHPEYQEVSVTCTCGNSFKTKSTRKGEIRLDVCSKCHPFYTGKQNIVDTEGRVEGFKKRFAQFKRPNAAKNEQTDK